MFSGLMPLWDSVDALPMGTDACRLAGLQEGRKWLQGGAANNGHARRTCNKCLNSETLSLFICWVHL